MSLIEKLKKNSTIKDTAILNNSKFFGTKDLIQTAVPALNVALSGRLDGGLTPGLTVFAGPSKHFKTAFSLLLAKSYLDKYDDAVVLFYDSEFGTPQAYFDTFNIDTSRVVHTPITDIEQLKHDVMQQMNGFERGDHVIVVVDSVGNLASKKEVDDALDGKSVADMTRAKQMKSLFRMVTPHLTIKDIPMVVVNHTYQEIGMFPKAVVSGGCVVAGTMIQTPDGLKAVEDFNVGEKVITVDGPKVVTHVWNPDTLEVGEPECYEVEFEDGYKVICSDKHKFLIDDRWVEAKDLSIGQDVSVV
jgi:RecA/RadA recombinase